MMPKFSQKPLVDATDAELRTFATEFLGLEVEPDSSSTAIASLILTAQGWAGDGTEMIFVVEAPEAQSQAGAPPPFVPGATAPVPAAPQGAMHGSLGHEDPKVTIRISNENRNGEVYSRDVAVGVNGRCCQLRRNVDVTIPYRVYLALRGAVEDSVTHDARTGEEMHTDVDRVPFTVIRLPSDEEVAAWHTKIDAVELA